MEICNIELRCNNDTTLSLKSQAVPCDNNRQLGYGTYRLAAIIEDIHMDHTEHFRNKNRARKWKPYAHQDIFIRCELEGRVYFETGEYERTYRIPQYYGNKRFSANRDTALKAFRDACAFFGIEYSSRRT